MNERKTPRPTDLNPTDRFRQVLVVTRGGGSHGLRGFGRQADFRSKEGAW